MKTYKCKCGSTNFWLEQNGCHKSLFCEECGRWLKNLKPPEARLWIHNQELKNK